MAYGDLQYGEGPYGGFVKFTSPSAADYLWTDHRLFGRYRVDRGVTVAISGDAVDVLQYPYQGDLENYDHVYMGGRVYQVDAAEAELLTEAGFGELIS